MTSVKKIKSVASALSVIDFEHLWSSRSDEHVNSVCVGTVFQTAAFFLFLIPRLRPGTINMTRMAVWKTVPYKLFRLRLTRHVQNLSRIKRMRRICSFTDFFIHLWFVCALPGAMIVTDYLLLEAIQHRIGANTIRSRSNITWLHKIKWNPWKR